MSDRSPGTPVSPGAPDGVSAPRRRTGTTWAVIRVLLLVGIVVPLLVPLYARETPALFGFPFYYWFQFLMIPVVSVLTYTAFRLSLRATEKDRRAFGLPTDSRPQDRGTDD
jgi:uncharacterized membrane protein